MKKLIGGLVVVSVLFLGCEKKSEEAPVETAAPVEAAAPVVAAPVETAAPVAEAPVAEAPVEANVTAETPAPAAN
ncbi:MAG: hypothetical protein QG565_1242 [Campylobacterota bacterium]|nr:hypothetical protein [Campylobacterota bacterium]MDQ1267647.1 hypothetical protein [Campylobacterota bacterium]MDQ1338133.1 hypothetical protein [Campylobacterota bacterium]